MGRIRESAFGTIDVPIVERSHGPMNEEVISTVGTSSVEMKVRILLDLSLEREWCLLMIAYVIIY